MGHFCPIIWCFFVNEVNILDSLKTNRRYTMTDRSKFEEMLERLVNEDREGAEALFHEIVVERSRDIYQSILESEDEDLEETEDEDLDESDDEDLDESDDEDLDESDEEELDESIEDDEDLDESDDEDLDEMFGLDEFAPGDGSDAAMGMGGDATDDMMGDMGADSPEGDDSEPATKSDIMDLNDALQELLSKFDEMEGDMSIDSDGDESDMDDVDMGDEGDMDDESDMDDEDETEEAFAYESQDEDLEEAKKMKKDDKKSKKTAGEEMREYVEKVSGGGLDAQKIGGDNGTNTKSIVASKNDMGGTTANILRTDTENSGEAAKGQIKGSSLHKSGKKEDNAGNINVPGGKAGKTAFKKSEPGHGAEKKGKPETADKGAHSTIRTTVRSK